MSLYLVSNINFPLFQSIDSTRDVASLEIFARIIHSRSKYNCLLLLLFFSLSFLNRSPRKSRLSWTKRGVSATSRKQTLVRRLSSNARKQNRQSLKSTNVKAKTDGNASLHFFVSPVCNYFYFFPFFAPFLGTWMLSNSLCQLQVCI